MQLQYHCLKVFKNNKIHAKTVPHKGFVLVQTTWSTDNGFFVVVTENIPKIIYRYIREPEFGPVPITQLTTANQD